MSHDLDLVRVIELELEKAQLVSGLLLAYSGGLDSSCLLELLLRAGQKPLLAHCNFQLRGEESEEDARFAASRAEKYSLQFQVKKFDTKTYAAENGISIQMAARDLRYAWFRELKAELGLRAIATGAHLDDQLEGMLIKLGRGSGPASLAGMAVWNAQLFRPLLSVSRQELEKFAESENVHYREDSSNASDNYLRNSLRHKIIPSWKKEVPELLLNVEKSRKRISEMERFVRAELKEFFEEQIASEAEGERIRLEALRGHKSSGLVLFYWLYEKGFTSAQIDNICESLDSTESKKFDAAKWTLFKERTALILTEESAPNFGEVLLQKGTKILELEGTRFELFYLEQVPEVFEENLTYFDADCLEFPLLFRSWQEGDRMQPMGMHGSKKVSDVLIDLKVEAAQKARQCVMESSGEIQWLLGRRQSEQSKVTARTTKLFCFRRLH